MKIEICSDASRLLSKLDKKKSDREHTMMEIKWIQVIKISFVAK
jgi:hypothetical protein